MRAYEVAQALDSVAQFWERLSSGDADLEDFENDFTGEKRRARKKAAAWLAHAISILKPGDQCPVCKTAHVQEGPEFALYCAGECGMVKPAPEAECENCGEECDYHPEICLCNNCQAETEPEGSQGGQDAEVEEGNPDDAGGDRSEEADQGAR